MNAVERKELQQELKAQGFVIRDLGLWPPKATYYKASGEPMPNLPADPLSMRSYMRRGFSLVPPIIPSSGGLKCESCGFEAKSELGLASHMRKHKRESKQGENE